MVLFKKYLHQTPCPRGIKSSPPFRHQRDPGSVPSGVGMLPAKPEPPPCRRSGHSRLPSRDCALRWLTLQEGCRCYSWKGRILSRTEKKSLGIWKAVPAALTFGFHQAETVLPREIHRPRFTALSHSAPRGNSPTIYAGLPSGFWPLFVFALAWRLVPGGGFQGRQRKPNTSGWLLLGPREGGGGVGMRMCSLTETFRKVVLN